METQLPQATQGHCAYCFDVIYATVKKQQLPPFPSTLQRISSPLFVTWHKNGDDLRGCIGTFGSQPLEQNLLKYAQISAFQDTRFNPIDITEFPQLSVGVSLLVNFQEGKKHDDWIIGKHGIIIDFTVNNQNYNATYLPEVAVEHNMTMQQCLKSLVKKAGYNQNYNNVLDLISLTTYESSKANMTYNEWAQLRNIQ